MLSPWGDVLAVARARCLLKPDSGRLIVGVPDGDHDLLVWNAHRQYGPVRWPVLLTNFRPTRVWRGDDEHAIVEAAVVHHPATAAKPSP